MLRKILLLAAAASLATASAAPAQTAAPAPQLGGPVIPGLCILGRDALFANAKVGQAANARLKALSDQAQAEIDRERTPLDAEVKAFEAQAKTLTPAQVQEKRTALATRLDALQRKAATRSREMELTRQKVTDRIGTEVEPVVAQVYKTRNCGALFSREAMMGANPAMDITAAVIQALDAKITTISFEREALQAAPRS
jgi:Skp family chaperone for outer membrane proteins